MQYVLESVISAVAYTVNYLSSSEYQPPSTDKEYDWTYTNVGQIEMDEDTWKHVDTLHRRASNIIMESRSLCQLKDVLDAESHVYAVMSVRDAIGYTLLQNAIIQSRSDIVKFLIKKGADLNAPICGRPLLLAMRLGQEKLIALLLRSGADPDQSGSVCYPLEHICSKMKYDERIQHFSTVCLGDNIHSIRGSCMAYTPLCHALFSDSLGCILTFLKHYESNTSQRNENINDWLWRKSCAFGALICLKHFSALVSKQAVNKVDKNGILPIQYAVMWGKPYLECVVHCGGNINAVLPHHQTLLHYLLSEFNNFNKQALEYPFHRQVDARISERLKYLLECGLSMNVNRLDDIGMTAILYFFNSYISDMKSYRAVEAAPSSQCVHSEYDMYSALRLDILESLKLLLSSGANTNIRCRGGKSCLHLLAAAIHLHESHFNNSDLSVEASSGDGASPGDGASSSDGASSGDRASSNDGKDVTGDSLQSFQSICALLMSEMLERLLSDGADPNAECYSRVSVSEVFLHNCFTSLPKFTGHHMMFIYMDSHVNVEYLKVLQKHGCNFTTKLAKKKDCWIHKIFHKLGRQLSIISSNIISDSPASELVLQYLMFVKQLLICLPTSEMPCVCGHNHFEMAYHCIRPYFKSIPFDVTYTFLHTILVHGCSPSKECESDTSLIMSFYYIKSGKSGYTIDEDTDITMLIANALGHTNSNLIMAFFLNHQNFGRPDIKRQQSLPNIVNRITSVKSLRYSCGYAIRQSMLSRLDLADELPLPKLLQKYLQTLAY